MFDQPLPAAFLPQGPPADFANDFRRIRRQNIPTSERIVAEAFDDLGYTRSTLSPDEVRERFDSLLQSVWRKTLEVLERYEERAYSQEAIGEVIRLHAEDLRKARVEMQADGDDAIALE